MTSSGLSCKGTELEIEKDLFKEQGGGGLLPDDDGLL